MGVEIRLGCGKMFNIWSAHFDGDRYGPDAISYGMVTTKKQIAAGEKRREQQVMQVREDKTMQKLISSCTVPIFFAGDFNSPSHLDWVESTQQLHGGWTFEWPATKILEDMGFRDSFRKLHPDPLKEPGITWSTVYKFKERSRNTIPAPQDRLDFILYKGRAKPVKSFIYCGNEKLIPMPNQWNNYRLPF